MLEGKVQTESSPSQALVQISKRGLDETSPLIIRGRTRKHKGKKPQTTGSSFATAPTTTTAAPTPSVSPWRPSEEHLNIGQDWREGWAGSYSGVTIFNNWLNGAIYLIGREYSGRLFIVGVRVVGITGFHTLIDAVAYVSLFAGEILFIRLFYPLPTESGETAQFQSGYAMMQYLERTFPQADYIDVHWYEHSMAEATHYRTDILEGPERILISYTTMVTETQPHIPEISHLPDLEQAIRGYQELERARNL